MKNSQTNKWAIAFVFCHLGLGQNLLLANQIVTMGNNVSVEYEDPGHLAKIHHFSCEIDEPLADKSGTQKTTLKFAFNDLDESAENLSFVSIEEYIDIPDFGYNELPFYVEPAILTDGGRSDLLSLMAQGGDAYFKKNQNGETVLRLFGDEDGFYWSELILYKNSQLTKGYFRVWGKDYAKLGGWIDPSVSCQHTIAESYLVALGKKIVDQVAPQLKDAKIKITISPFESAINTRNTELLADASNKFGSTASIVRDDYVVQAFKAQFGNDELNKMIDRVANNYMGEFIAVVKDQSQCPDHCEIKNYAINFTEGLNIEFYLP